MNELSKGEDLVYEYQAACDCSREHWVVDDYRYKDKMELALLKYVRYLETRIAELEAESERFTVHSNIERQDDKWIPEVQE